MKSATNKQQPNRKTEREQRLDRAAEKVVQQARQDAATYLRDSKVPGGGE